MATATLKGRLTLNDSLFTSGLRRAKNEGTRFAKQIGSNLKGFITQPLAAAGAAIAAAISYKAFEVGIKGSVGLGDQLYKLSKQTGISVGSLAQLKKASLESSVEFDSVAKGVAKMQRSLIEASKGRGGPASVFRLLKLEVRDLLALKPEQQFQKIGVAINALPDAATRTAVAFQIFGRAGAGLLPVFEEIGKADFGHLDEKSKILQQNAKDFHDITVMFRKIGANLQSFFVGFAAGFKPILQVIGTLSGKNPFASWGKSIGRFFAMFVEFQAGIWGFAKDFITALIKALGDAFSKIKGPLAAFLAPLKEVFAAIVAAIAKIGGNIVKRGKTALGVTEEPTAVPPVTVEGYHSPLDIGQGIQSGTVDQFSKEAWQAQFAPRGHHLAFGGPLSSEAFGQTGGLGSKSRWDPAEIAKLSTEDQAKMLLSPAEWQSAENQRVAAGGQRAATSPYAYGAVASGDDQRRQNYLKEQLKAKLGLDKTNEILSGIQETASGMADDISDIASEVDSE